MDRNHVFRNQASTKQKIQMIASLRITTREEAIAFLRAVGAIEVQIANIMQRDNMTLQSIKNHGRKVEEKPVQPEPVVEEEKPETVDFTEEEEHSESEKQSRLEQLKKALKKDK